MLIAAWSGEGGEAVVPRRNRAESNMQLVGRPPVGSQGLPLPAIFTKRFDRAEGTVSLATTLLVPVGT